MAGRWKWALLYTSMKENLEECRLAVLEAHAGFQVGTVLHYHSTDFHLIFNSIGFRAAYPSHRITSKSVERFDDTESRQSS